MPTPGSAARALALALALAFAIGTAVSAPGPALAQEGGPADTGRSVTLSDQTGLPLPRFVSVASDEANLRTGPGRRYPIEWTYVRRNLPVEILDEYDTWRRVRDHEGIEGWMHQSLLSGRRYAMIRPAEPVTLMARPEATAAAVARVEPGVLVRVLRCPLRDGAAWCEVEAAGYDGWVHRDRLWGVYAGELVD